MCHPSLVWYLSECSRGPGQALCCTCSNNPLLWWLITCSAGKRHVEGWMCCFSNHLFSSDSVTCRKDERLTYQSWKNRATHRIYVEHFKAKETYCLRSPLKQVFLSNLPNIQWNALKKQLPFFVCCFMCIFCSVFSLTKLSTILPLFFGRLSELNIGKP